MYHRMIPSQNWEFGLEMLLKIHPWIVCVCMLCNRNFQKKKTPYYEYNENSGGRLNWTFKRECESTKSRNGLVFYNSWSDSIMFWFNYIIDNVHIMQYSQWIFKILLSNGSVLKSLSRLNVKIFLSMYKYKKIICFIWSGLFKT